MRLTDAGLKLGMAAALGMAVATGAVAQSAQQQLSSESVVETIKKRGALKVGMSTFVPWAMRDKNGELVGFEIDVAKKVAADMDVDVEFVPTSWDGIIPALIAGKFDVIIGGMSVRPQRNLTINFTIPYAHSGMGIAANKAMTADMKWPDDYDSADVTFSCRRGATSCNDVDRLFPKATVRKFDDDVQAFQESPERQRARGPLLVPEAGGVGQRQPGAHRPSDHGQPVAGRRGVRPAQGRSGRAELLLQLDPRQHDERLAGGAPTTTGSRPGTGRGRST